MLKSLNQHAGSIESFDEIGTVLGEASLQVVYQFIRRLYGDSRDPHAFSHSHPIDIRVVETKKTRCPLPDFVDPQSPVGGHRKELTYSGFQPPFVIPPVQIRTCAANASGSCFESDAQTLPFGAPCLNRSLILPASEFRTQEGKQNSSQPSPFAPQAPLISFALLLSTNDLIVRRFIATTNLSDFLKT